MWKVPGALPTGYQDWLQVTLPEHQSPVMGKCSFIINYPLYHKLYMSSCISHLPPILYCHTCSNTSRFPHDASQHRFAKSFGYAISFQSMGGCVPCCSLTLVITLKAMRDEEMDHEWTNIIFQGDLLQGEIALLCQGGEHFLLIWQGKLAFKILRPSNKYPIPGLSIPIFPS